MFHNLWSFIDEDNLDNMEYDKLRRIFMGEMSEPRKAEMKKVGEDGGCYTWPFSPTVGVVRLYWLKIDSHLRLSLFSLHSIGKNFAFWHI